MIESLAEVTIGSTGLSVTLVIFSKHRYTIVFINKNQTLTWKLQKTCRSSVWPNHIQTEPSRCEITRIFRSHFNHSTQPLSRDYIVFVRGSELNKLDLLSFFGGSVIEELEMLCHVVVIPCRLKQVFKRRETVRPDGQCVPFSTAYSVKRTGEQDGVPIPIQHTNLDNQSYDLRSTEKWNATSTSSTAWYKETSN